jgi:5-methylcytosine-specific restriction enzyme subunit McrC
MLNWALLAGINHATTLATDNELKAHIRRIGKVLSATVASRHISRQLLDDAWRSMDRRTVAYKPALTLISLLFADQGLTLDDETRGTIRLNGFLFDMNRFFQALIARFLSEHLDGFDVHNEFWLKDIFKYLKNPLHLRRPALRPDFVVMAKGRTLSILDAKYRDLWDRSLPPEMLYQLALYALGRPSGERVSAIIYPTVDQAAREQSIGIQEPVRGTTQASVILRPINLLKLDKLIRAGHAQSSQRVKLAEQLVFGESQEQTIKKSFTGSS